MLQYLVRSNYRPGISNDLSVQFNTVQYMGNRYNNFDLKKMKSSPERTLSRADSIVSGKHRLNTPNVQRKRNEKEFIDKH